MFGSLHELPVRLRVLLVRMGQDEGRVLLLGDVHVETDVRLPHDVPRTWVQLDGGDSRVLLNSNKTNTISVDT